jgi:4-amino-4-deoxy-L-arabinose transferase-like glycosyltransferase
MDGWLGALDRKAVSALGWLAVRPRWTAAFLIALCLAMNLPGIASLPVTDRDEARFAQATKQMLESGDFIDIRFQDDPRYKKPIGAYWLQAASVKLFGSGETNEIWAYRVPSFLGILAAVLLTWWAARAPYGRKNALLAAILMAAALGVNLEARLAKADAVLLACIILAQGALARIYLARQAPRETAGVAALFWIALGAGILVKGPVAPGMAFLTILPLAVYDPERSWLRSLHFPWGVPLLLAITLPWFIAIGITSEWAFFRDSIGQDFLGKLKGGQEAHWGPPGYYFILFWATFWPGALIATSAGAFWLWRNRMHRRALFLLAWIIPFWLVLEATPTKLPHYVLPIYPAIAIGAAWVLREVAIPGTVPLRTYKQAAGIWLFVAALLVLFLVLLHTKFHEAPSPALLLLAVPFAAAAYLTARAAWTERFHAALVMGTVSAMLFYVGVFRVALPNVDAIWVSQRIDQIAEMLKPCSTTPMMLTRYREPSAVFLMGTDTRMETETEALEAMRKGATDFAVFNADAFNRIARSSADGAEMPQVLACINGFHTTQGRKLRLHVLTMKSPEALAACQLPPRYGCSQ